MRSRENFRANGEPFCGLRANCRLHRSNSILGVTEGLVTLRGTSSKFRMTSMQSWKTKALTCSAFIVFFCLVAYVAAGAGLSVLKEWATTAYVPEVRSELLTLHTIQEDYRVSYGWYASTFSDMGIPVGATLQDEALYWSGPYRFRLSRIIRDQNGNVARYEIEARPVWFVHGSQPVFQMDDSGTIRP